MSLEKLNRAAEQIRFYDRVLADIEDVLHSEHPIDSLKRKQKRYVQYKAVHEKQFREALKMAQKRAKR